MPHERLELRPREGADRAGGLPRERGEAPEVAGVAVHRIGGQAPLHAQVIEVLVELPPRRVIISLAAGFAAGPFDRGGARR